MEVEKAGLRRMSKKDKQARQRLIVKEKSMREGTKVNNNFIAEVRHSHPLFKFKIFKSFFLMQAQLTEFLLRITFESKDRNSDSNSPSLQPIEAPSYSSAQILTQIYDILNSEKNYKPARSHEVSLSSDDTNPQSPLKCNCKKSKCLKLYCQCFSKGSFCKDCNCECCQNTAQFSEIRARAIDEMLIKTSSFGYKSASSVKGCNCKKTGCQKKYCECFNQNLTCNEYCKCSNCENIG